MLVWCAIMRLRINIGLQTVSYLYMQTINNMYEAVLKNQVEKGGLLLNSGLNPDSILDVIVNINFFVIH